MVQINLPLTSTILKITSLSLAFLTMCLAAAFIVMRRNYSMLMTSIIEVSNPAANGQIASSVFNILFFSANIAFLFFRPDSIFISMIVDTSMLGFLFLFSIGATGSMTAQSPYFGNCNNSGGHCHVGQAAVAFGWFTTLTILSLLALQVIITLMRYGMSLDTWKTPFNQLVLYGSTKSESRVQNGNRHRGIGSESGAANGSVYPKYMEEGSSGGVDSYAAGFAAAQAQAQAQVYGHAPGSRIGQGQVPMQQHQGYVPVHSYSSPGQQ